MKRPRFERYFQIAVIGLFTSVISLSAAETETDYMAILLQGKKIGHAVHIRAVESDKIITTERFSMTLGRGGQAVTVASQEKHIETPDGKPLGFEMSLTTSGVEQKTTGTVQDGKATISRQVMGQAQELTVDWPAGAMLSEGLRKTGIKHGLASGTAYEVSLFRPDMLTTVEAKVEVGEKKKIALLLGRQKDLTEVKTTMSVQGQQIVVTGYVDEQLKAIKTLVPMMGMELEMVACDEAFARQENAIVDFLEKLSIASPVKLINLPVIESAVYTLKPTTDTKLELPISSTQTVEVTETGLIVTVTKLQPPKEIAFPYKGDDPKALEALKETDYMQSTNRTIIDLAKRAVGETKDAADASRQIEAFVDGYITQKDLSVGYASAAEVAQSRQGDCSEHAVLAAAMCRAVGIPARIVCGVVYADTFLGKQSIFGGHMWVEVYLDGDWYGLDATRSEQAGFSPGHIALAHGNGDPTDFFGLVNTLGCFEIEKITLNKKKPAAEKAIEPKKNGE
ncbi:MAG: transglutaminase-like domain-containing protein [Planctomycetota bacterium]